MSIAISSETGQANFLYPLVQRTRPEAVNAQLAELSRLTPGQIRRRIGETAKEKWLARETLVAVVRACRRSGDEETARQAMDVLIRRLRPAISARAKAWRTLDPSDYEDAEGQVVAKIIGYINNLAPGEELWECNFAGCFNLRGNSVLKACAAKRTAAVSAYSVTASGEERDLLSELPDTGAETSFEDIEVQELIASLSRDNPQVAEFLYLSLAGVSEAEIAGRLKVTDRTLRNWKAKMRRALTQNKED